MYSFAGQAFQRMQRKLQEAEENAEYGEIQNK